MTRTFTCNLCGEGRHPEQMFGLKRTQSNNPGLRFQSISPLDAEIHICADCIEDIVRISSSGGGSMPVGRPHYPI